MTIVEVFRCRSCSFQEGPFGTHGFDPKTRSGELMGKCPACKTLDVVRVEGGKFARSCHRCGGPYEHHDGKCPACGSANCGFTFAL